jgi:DNA-directed RNA polymerase subunit RPC12/RpoP
MIIFLVLALSLTALILATTALGQGNEVVAGYLMLLGFIGLALSTYVLFQTRRRILRLRIETSPITTTIECKKCGFKSTREFQRGDYIFKELEPCQKCNDKMLITAIFREVKEKEKGPVSP